MRKISKNYRYFIPIFLLALPFLFGSCEQADCTHQEEISSVVAATCEHQGYTLWECTDCGHSYQTDFVEPLEHTYTESTVAATCESGGYRLRTCQTCAQSYKTEITSALGHTLSSTTQIATCTEGGFTEYSCSVCSLTYRDEIVAPLGHDLCTTDRTLPTVTSRGTLTERCSRCELSFTGSLDYHDIFVNAYVSSATPIAKGLDISYHNHAPNENSESGYDALDWALIKEKGFDFAILRAGYIGFLDPVFEMNYRDAKAAGIDLGVYYYSYAKNEEQAIEEANELIGWLAGKQFEYPIYYDIEDSRLTSIDKETLTNCCIAFIETLRDAGYYGALYSNNPWLTNYLDGNLLKEYSELWYARYQRDPANAEAAKDFSILHDDENFEWLESYGTPVGMWQYTACGVIEGSGMDQKADFNYVYKDYPSIIKRFCLNGYTPTAQ